MARQPKGGTGDPAESATPSPSCNHAMSSRLLRAQVPTALTWDLSDLFPDKAAWEAGFQDVDTARQSMAAHQGRLGDSGATLLAGLEARESLQARLIRLRTFAYLRNAQDGTNAQHQAALARVSALQARLEADTSFVDAEILGLPEGRLQALMAAEPRLQEFSVPLNDLQALRPHRLGAEAERTLAALGEVMDAPYAIYRRTKSSDMQFAPFTDAAGTVHANSFNGFESRFETDADPSVRRAAWASFTEGLKAHHHTCAATFATEVSKNVAIARLRRYPSTESYLLQTHKVPREVYNNILDIIQAELAPHMRRYARLRRRVLGLDKLLYCDIKAPLTPTSTHAWATKKVAS